MLKFVVKRKNFKAFVKDYREKIQKSGIYLRTSRDISEGDEVNVVFQFPEENIEISGIGEVSWVDEEVDATGRRGFLVRNIVLTPESLELLENANDIVPPQISLGDSTQAAESTHTQHYTQPPPPPPDQTSPPVQQPPVLPPQQPPQNYTQPPSYQPQTPPPYQMPPQQSPSQQPPPTQISVNVSSGGSQVPPPYQQVPPQNVLLEEDLKKLRGSRGWIWVLIFLIIIAAGGFWFFGMGGKEYFIKKEVVEKAPPQPTPPPQSPQPQKVVVEVKQVAPEPKPEPQKKPEPAPPPKPKKKKKKIVVRPAGLKDFVYTSGSNFTHLEFIFNRPYKKFIPSPLADSLNIYVPNAYNDTGQDQYFINSSLVRSVVITRENGTLAITIYPTTPSLPYYEFDRESDRIIVNFYKSH